MYIPLYCERAICLRKHIISAKYKSFLSVRRFSLSKSPTEIITEKKTFLTIPT